MDWIGRSSCDTTTAYIYYAISNQEVSPEIRDGIQQLYNQIVAKPDDFSTYIIALHGLTMLHQQEEEKAAALRAILLTRQAKDGAFSKGKETITSWYWMNDSNVESGDEGVLVETTALAAINLMHEKQGVASQLALASLYLLNHQKVF